MIRDARTLRASSCLTVGLSAINRRVRISAVLLGLIPNDRLFNLPDQQGAIERRALRIGLHPRGRPRTTVV
jgi:hypothetical protein